MTVANVKYAVSFSVVPLPQLFRHAEMIEV